MSARITVTDEMRVRAAKAMADDWNPERDPILTAMFRDYAASALEAAAPLIAAQAWDEGFAEGCRGRMWDSTNPYERKDER